MIGSPQPAPGSASEGGRAETQPAGLAGCGELVQALYLRSGAARFDISAAEFSLILAGIAAKYLSSEAEAPAVRELLAELHVEDLALARACAAGHAGAWEVLLTRYRERLYQTAAAIAHDDTLGRELADSLYADLYGSDPPGGARQSKLNSYTGLGSLAAWLATVLARAHVDRYRREPRWTPLEEANEDDPQLVAPAAEATVPVDPRLERATREALAALPAEDGFILVSYYLDGRTLAEIARTLQVHESTISRRVEKIAAKLRRQIRDTLLRQGMSRAQAEEAMQADVRDLQLNAGARLRKSLQESQREASSIQSIPGSASGGKS